MKRPEYLHLGCLLPLLLLMCGSAFGQKVWMLHIDVPTADQAHGPNVKVGGTPAAGVRLDPASGRWIVPIASAGTQFVTSYVVSLPEKNVVAVRIGVPARILEANQSVSLMPTSLTQVDEATVRGLWQSNEITSSPGDPQIQFHYLQDLIYVTRGLMERPGAVAHRPSAMRMRVSFMLLQVVRNLSQNTWFLVDPTFQDVIDFAAEDLRAAQAAGKCQSWLGASACQRNRGVEQGVEQLLSTIRSLQGNQLSRMYAALVPDGATLDAAACSADQLRDMRDFYSYFHGEAEQTGGATGPTETRVLNDIAACYSVKARCTDSDAQTAIRTLMEGSQFITEFGTRSTSRQLRALNNALIDIQAGNAPKCPEARRR